ncbi:RE2 [Symbiodinium sp. CCMP2592]|nr:RE2 [Symbiodinium sp. CCMP2592]
MAIQKMKKAELQSKLRELGEEPPTKWTNKELAQRILEIEPSLGEKKGKQRTDLQTKIKDLGVAARKKSTLTTFCKEIGVDLSGNHNMWSMEQDWVLKTAASSTSTADYRLLRLASWLEQQTTEEIELYKTQEQPKKAAPKAKGYPGPAASSSTEVPTELLQSMMQSLQSLQQEVMEMRAERPRKEVRGKSMETKTAEPDVLASEPGPGTEEKGLYLSKESASHLENKAWTLVPQLFQDLVSQSRPILLEVTGSSEGQLAQTVQDEVGQAHAAIRCGDWNGHDLSTDAGVRSLLEKIATLQPLHVWINPPSAAFSPYQNANQRKGWKLLTTHQLAELLHALDDEPDDDDTALYCQGELDNHNDDAYPNCVLGRHQMAKNESASDGPSGGARYTPKFSNWPRVSSARCVKNVAESNHEHVQFMMIVDEGSRFRAARVLTSGLKQQPSAAACLEYLRDGWIPYFGSPQTIRLDPAGAFRGSALEDFCDRHQIYLDVIPGKAHWKLSAVEQAVQGVKSLMGKLVSEDPELETREALATAIRTFNQREIIRGFSPVQHALGQSPDASGRMDFSGKAVPPELLIENPNGEFSRNVERQRVAEQALADWQAQQRLSRAQSSRGRRVLNFTPGELVYFWRSQVSGQSRKQPGDKKGQFLGPARILATETKRNEDGTLQPSSSVWLVRGRSLIKCAAEQVRRASNREELIESLDQGNQVPWTFTRVAEEIGGNRYQDVTESVPEDEWFRAQDVEQAEPPVRRRVGHKRPLEPATSARPLEQAAATPQPSSHRARPYPPTRSEQGHQWWSDVQDAMWGEELNYWADEAAAVSVELELPTGQKQLQQACRDLPTYFVGCMKRRAIEVSEKRMSDEERKLFREAKMIEVKNFVAAKAFETLPEALKPPKEVAVGMRWILTWKVKEDGTSKPKARAVLLGYQDPSYEHRATTAPVMTRQTRQLVLQVAANKGWSVAKGDVSGAFLQGREYPDRLYCIPCPEICEALQIPAESITRLRRACYGLVDAPLEWYKTVDEFLTEQGLQRLWSDACCWVLRDNDQVVGLISGHVDDFLFTGCEANEKWKRVIEAIQKRFKWGDWDRDDFVQCGVQIKRVSDGFELTQVRYIETLKEIPICASRKKQDTEATTDREKSQLRALLGGLSWHAQQIGPHLSAEVSLLLSEVSQSQVSTISKANACLRRARAHKTHAMKIHAFTQGEELGMFGWVDAGNQNRIDGYSTQGIFIGLAPVTMLQGSLCRVTPVAWHSNRIDRACRSPGASEAQAAVNGEDALFFARYQRYEIMHGCVDVRAPAQAVRQISGCLITDSRNVYDRLNTAVLSIKGAEKRTNIELIALKESQEQTGLIMRWVHSEAQLANALTKASTCRELELY